jgi:surfeit locus 1 family protein
LTPRRLLVPALSTAVMILLLLGLGTWQVQRRAWKLGILEQVAAAERDPAVKLRPGLPPFAKVFVTGRLRLDLAAWYGADVRGDVLGAQLIVPLERADAAPVLVDLGWLPQGARPREPAGESTVTGFIRPGERPGWFAAADDPARRLFYTLDPPALGAALGLRAAEPFTVVALGQAPPPGAPDPARHLPSLPNNHLQYAITWYALAVVLAVVFVVYVRKGAHA